MRSSYFVSAPTPTRAIRGGNLPTQKIFNFPASSSFHSHMFHVSHSSIHPQILPHALFQRIAIDLQNKPNLLML